MQSTCKAPVSRAVSCSQALCGSNIGWGATGLWTLDIAPIAQGVVLSVRLVAHPSCLCSDPEPELEPVQVCSTIALEDGQRDSHWCDQLVTEPQRLPDPEPHRERQRVPILDVH